MLLKFVIITNILMMSVYNLLTLLCVLYYICNEAQENLRVRLGSRKTSLSPPPPSILILTVPRQYFCCSSLLLLVLAVCIYTLVHQLCDIF